MVLQYETEQIKNWSDMTWRRNPMKVHCDFDVIKYRLKSIFWSMS